VVFIIVIIPHIIIIAAIMLFYNNTIVKLLHARVQEYKRQRNSKVKLYYNGKMLFTWFIELTCKELNIINTNISIFVLYGLSYKTD